MNRLGFILLAIGVIGLCIVFPPIILVLLVIIGWNLLA